MDLFDFPPTSLTDYLVHDLGRCYELTRNRLLLRVNLAWLLEVQLKKIMAYYEPERFNKAKGSHHVLRSVFKFKGVIPELHEYIRQMYMESLNLNRLSAIQNFDYTSARYGGAAEVSTLELPLVEDMFELYWILANHTRELNIL